MSTARIDPFAADLARSAPPVLSAFNRAGVLRAADVHVAVTLGRLAGLGDGPAVDAVLLAAALAVRAPRLGHVFVDLATIAQTADVEGDTELDTEVEAEHGVEVEPLRWPEAADWVARVAACGPLVAVGEEADGAPGGPARPLRLVGSRLYLDRYWREERDLADGLLAFASAPLAVTDVARLGEMVRRLFPHPDDVLPRWAAGAAALRSLTVVAGGPGTGKTTTVARMCALLLEDAHAAGRPAPLIGLCAPTGKAAARLREAVHAEAASLDVPDGVRDALRELRGSTIHRLLGWRPRSHSRFRHDAINRLPHDVVIVDETSMVPLTLMARLAEAVRSNARLVLVGDPDQLAAIEAGAVLRDIVGPAADRLRVSPPMRVLLERVTGSAPAPLEDEEGSASSSGSAGSFGDGVVVLRRGHRFGAGIDRLADAIRRGDGDRLLAAISGHPDEITWIDLDVAVDDLALNHDQALAPLRAEVVRSGAAVLAAAQEGDGPRALAALGRFRLLCAHRRGPYGASAWSARAERWLLDGAEGYVPGEHDYVGRPLLVTANDYELRLHNGDTGVVVRDGDGLLAVFERDGESVAYAPSRLGSLQTLHAMTIHKSQGSQFELAAVVLPDEGSRILTRELLYTAVTRARQRLLLVGSEAALRAAAERAVARATGLRERLWKTPAAG